MPSFLLLLKTHTPKRFSVSLSVTLENQSKRASLLLFTLTFHLIFKFTN